MESKGITFISVVRDMQMYNECFTSNQFIDCRKATLSILDNRSNNLGIAERYNQFIESYDYTYQTWFIFCHEDWEVLEPITPHLTNLSKDCLYGVFGAKLRHLNGDIFRDYVGQIEDCTKQKKNSRIIGIKIEDIEEVDTLDCQCLVVHSSLIDRLSLIFDEGLKCDHYVEDFCLNGRVQHGLKSKVLTIKSRHRSQLNNINERPSYTRSFPYFNSKYFDYTFAGIGYNIGKNTEKIKTTPLKIEKIQENP